MAGAPRTSIFSRARIFGLPTAGPAAWVQTSPATRATISLLLRANYTASPTLTLQIYASPFVSKGSYTNVRELNDPRARTYDDRFRPYSDTAVANNPGGFDVKFFNSNTVLRWEYQPGSTLYLVWSQGRDDFDGVLGTRSFTGDFRQLFRAPANNT